MLSYRHALHAGNHADVLKHLTLVHVLDDITAKRNPVCYIETHAGAGHYPLDSASARQSCELDAGIGRLWQRADLPASVARYVALVEELNPGGALRHYPGSPWLARRLLRAHDRLVLFELHPSEIGALTDLFTGDDRAKVVHGNGLAGGIGLLPPKERRGLILIDPTYEVEADYRTAVHTLTRAYRRFAAGIFALWYPVIDRNRIEAMEQTIRASGIPRVQVFELTVAPRSPSERMVGSGMLLVNPPWTLAPSMQNTLPWLAAELGVTGQGRFRIWTIAGDT